MIGRIDRTNETRDAHRAREIIDHVCQHFGVNTLAFLSPRRPKTLAHVRHIVFYVLGRSTSLTLGQIAALCGRDHTTVIYGMRKVARLIAADADLARTVAGFVRHFGAGGKCEEPVGGGVNKRMESMSDAGGVVGEPVGDFGKPVGADVATVTTRTRADRQPPRDQQTRRAVRNCA